MKYYFLRGELSTNASRFPTGSLCLELSYISIVIGKITQTRLQRRLACAIDREIIFRLISSLFAPHLSLGRLYGTPFSGLISRTRGRELKAPSVQ